MDWSAAVRALRGGDAVVGSEAAAPYGHRGDMAPRWQRRHAAELPAVRHVPGRGGRGHCGVVGAGPAASALRHAVCLAALFSAAQRGHGDVAVRVLQGVSHPDAASQPGCAE